MNIDKLKHLPKLHEFLDQQITSARGKDWETTPLPILNYWADANFMANFEKRTDLLRQNEAKEKLKQWFCNNDLDFLTITSEQYLSTFLESANKPDSFIFKPNFDAQGIDGTLQLVGFNNYVVGIEITTINDLSIGWSFSERIRLFAAERKIDCSVSWKPEIVLRECREDGGINKLNKDVIPAVKEALLTKNLDVLSKWGLNVDFPGSGYWSESHVGNWYETIEFMNSVTYKVARAIKGKERQLESNRLNLIFVGVNQVKNDYLNPRIFKNNPESNEQFKRYIDFLSNYFQLFLPGEILGVVFFVYSLDILRPYYPVQIFWGGGGVVNPKILELVQSWMTSLNNEIGPGAEIGEYSHEKPYS